MEDNDEAVLRIISQNNKKVPFWQTYLCTAISACHAELYTYPFDVTKTRLHLQGEAANRSGTQRPKRGMLGTFYGIAKEEGFRSLYGGLTAMFLRCFTFNAFRVYIYDTIRQQLIIVRENGKEELPIYRAAIGGGIAGSIGQFLCHPFDLCKIRLQMEGHRKLLGMTPRVTSVQTALKDMYNTSGIRGCWKGGYPSCVRALLMTVGDTAMYDVSKRKIMQITEWPDGRIIQLLSSISAGFFASVLSTPTDVVKSRVINQPFDEKGVGLHYKGAIDCFIKLIKQEGVFAMYKGFTPCWIRIGPWSLAFWLTFEQMRSVIGVGGF